MRTWLQSNNKRDMEMNSRVINTVGTVAALFLFANASAIAAPIYTQTFDGLGEPGKSIEDFNSFPVAVVSSGSVDLVASGDYGITCAGGGGKCVDLNGTSGVGGTVDLASLGGLRDGEYRVSFELSGNQRGSSGFPGATDSDTLELDIGGKIHSFTKAPDEGFKLYTIAFIVDAQNPVFSIGFRHIDILPNDNIGLILDNVTLSSVPLPATAPLFLTAIAALSAFKRRRKAVNVA
jgi:hypothetical protein